MPQCRGASAFFWRIFCYILWFLITIPKGIFLTAILTILLAVGWIIPPLLLIGECTQKVNMKSVKVIHFREGFIRAKFICLHFVGFYIWESEISRFSEFYFCLPPKKNHICDDLHYLSKIQLAWISSGNIVLEFFSEWLLIHLCRSISRNLRSLSSSSLSAKIMEHSLLGIFNYKC